MTAEDRLRRPEPARTGPKRAFNPLAAAAEAKPPGPAEPMTVDAIIHDAVDAAYRVVEENVREGRRTAERLRAGVTATASDAESAKAAANRVMHLSKELSVSWVELIMAVLRDSELKGVLDRLTAQDRGRVEPAHAAAGRGVTQRLSSRKPIEVALSSLPIASAETVPGVAGLHCLTPGHPAIVAVGFSSRPDGALELRIDVPDDQPAGVYTGAVVDPGSGEGLGTLTVRVLE